MSRNKLRTRTTAHSAVRYRNMSYLSVRPAPPKRKVIRRRTRFLVLVLTIAVIEFILWPRHEAPQKQAPSNTPWLTKADNKSEFDKKQHPLDQPGSLWWMVSKARPLQPQDYAPANLVNPPVTLRLEPGDEEMHVRAELAPELQKMFAAAKRENLNLMLASGFRSYGSQVNVYNQNVQQFGEAKARETSAAPGTSEHQTGLAVDIGPADRRCELEVCFADSAEGKWLATHAYEYGFILRYPSDKTAITGYSFEPWHFRYVGKDLSLEMHKQNIQTLEEFFADILNKKP